LKTRTILSVAAFVILAIGIAKLSAWNHYEANTKEIGEAKILFLGDMMFDRTMRKVAEAKGYDYLLSCVKDYLSGFDLVIGNLEGPITLSTSTSLGTKPGEPGNTSFTFSPEAALALFRSNIRAVSLGNNHMLDKGREGAESTRAFLDLAGVSHFGSPEGNLSLSREVGGVEIALVSFNQFLGQGDPEKTVSEIWKLRRDADFVFVFAHWGNEYEPATDYQKALAHRFIDAGADMVVGAHPHVVQETESYGGKSIYYSLGNFIFDQYWNEKVRRGGGVNAFLSKDGVFSSLERFESSRDGKICLAK
jgi:poly-gamma-glutamate capsule biosynthesis protein CapA/YwtB (metallophosphatase superfamily)